MGTSRRYTDYSRAGAARRRCVALLVALLLLLIHPFPGRGHIPPAPRRGVTTRVSVDRNGIAANAWSYAPAISPDGRFVAFVSQATNLIPQDTNIADDIFVYDRERQNTTRVSVASDGSAANCLSGYPALSAEGRFVAFMSLASNLVPQDTNLVSDVFVHDRQTGTTERVSVASDGTQADQWSSLPVLSADGRLVAFASRASNLVPGDVAFTQDIFIHDRSTRRTERLSVASDGTPGNNDSVLPSLSDDGRFVAFVSLASNLVPQDSNDASDIFVHDRQTETTERVSVASDGAQGNDWSLGPTLSGDGRFVTFTSFATNLVPQDSNLVEDIFVHDLATGETGRVSVALDGTEGNNWSSASAISADGRWVAFTSAATNLVPHDTNPLEDIFLYDRATGEIERVSVASDGAQSDSWSSNPILSGDGRTIGFMSDATTLTPDRPPSQIAAIFVHHRLAYDLYLPLMVH